MKVLIIDPVVEMVIEKEAPKSVALEVWASVRLSGAVRVVTSKLIPGHKLLVGTEESFNYRPSVGFLLDDHETAFLGGAVLVGWDGKNYSPTTLTPESVDRLIDWWSRHPKPTVRVFS